MNALIAEKRNKQTEIKGMGLMNTKDSGEKIRNGENEKNIADVHFPGIYYSLCMP